MQSSVNVTSGKTGLLQHVQARKHSFWSDEPEVLGGTDSGPTPFELLLSSLGSCISITMMLYAQRKGWDIDTINVSLAHERIQTQKEIDGVSQTGYDDVITKRVEVAGMLDNAQRGKLLEIAGKCPVHRLLSTGVTIIDGA
jgi:putative redox protein